MTWHCISPPHSDEVIPTSRYFIERGITEAETIKSHLRQWEQESVQAVIRAVERACGSTAAAPASAETA
jgi:hypothetical protein